MIKLLSIFLLCVALEEATVLPGSVFHAAPNLPCSWRRVEGLLTPKEHSIIVHFVLKQRSIEKLKQIAKEVSDPRSSTYGHFLLPSEVRRLTAPDPVHKAVVEKWLIKAGVPFNYVGGGATIEALCSVASASVLLGTGFHNAFNDETGQRVVRAGDFWLPKDVHEAVAAVYGLHGLPLPPRTMRRSIAEVPEVTPAVLAATYNISGVEVSDSMINRQAVAEFQGEATNATDLQTFFKRYVPSARPADAQVNRFVGDNGTGSEGGEAGLDIQYIMGPAPGIKTEFWYWSGNDFCADLKNWTDAVLSDEHAPLVHSVSYGYQGPLDVLGCAQSNVEDVDVNFVKLAARGITIIFSSGDSGAGYQPSCASDTMAANTSVEGAGRVRVHTVSAGQCCNIAGNEFAAWTYTPPSMLEASTCSSQSGEEFQGMLLASGQANSSRACCEIANDGSYSDVEGYTFDHKSLTCSLFTSISSTKANRFTTSSVVTSAKRGICIMYRTFIGKVSTHGATSGGASVKPVLPMLYPSWPASSPWVTSVGATRFMNQKVGEPEMASDEFGSGGGFSTMFKAFEDQADAVKHYLQVAADLPPQGAFPPGGRATPDVAALGEGYAVLVDGELQSVGGTSASTPAFAAMVSLLNEARLQGGKKPMGYLNPFLYQNAHAFMDVTVGTNAIGRGTGPSKWGFRCAVGWDPATGLGTPIFSKLLASAMNTSSHTIVV